MKIVIPAALSAWTLSWALLAWALLTWTTLGGPQAARAQSPAPVFDLSYVTPNTTVASPLPPGTKAVFPTVSVGATSTITVILTNLNDVVWTIGNSSVLGSGFRITSTTTTTVNPHAQSLINLAFTPTSRGQYDGSLILQMQSGSSGTATLNVLLHAQAVQSQLILSYIIQPAGNQTPLNDADTIQMPSTPVGTTSSATIVVTNTGDGTGAFTAATVAGNGFSIAALPLLPASVAASGQPNAEIRFSVVFTPPASQEYKGTLAVTIDGRKLTVNLDGTGTSASFQYAITANGKDYTPISPNGSYTFAQTAIGTTTSVTMKVTNTGNGDGKIGAILASNAVFTVTNAPALPATITAGNSLVFVLNFVPADSITYNANLFIDNATFNLSGVGIGSKLTFATITAGTSAALSPNGPVLFPNTSVGASNTVTVRITNSGNADATVSNVVGSGSPFAPVIPALPVKLSPGATLDVPITFSPGAIGAAKGTLQIDNFAFTLQGAGNPPPALPSFSFTGVGNVAKPLDQPTVGITLSTAYPLDITGVLKLGFTSAAIVDDPNIVFIAGGRSVAFCIPANTTDALFGKCDKDQGSKTVQFQAGTVAGTITLTPSFATGSADLTPVPNPSQQVTMAATQPVLRPIQVVNKSNTGFQLILTGYSTPRALSTITFQFAQAASKSLLTTQLDMNVGDKFGAWYQGVGSTPFGSQFSAVINISVSGDITAVQSVSVTAANASGVSTPVTVNLQ